MTVSASKSDAMVLMNSSAQAIDAQVHQDYIYKCAFDTYGRRMATCSGDRNVRVWDLTDSGEWTLTAQWQAHKGAVVSLSWAHPEFGSILATCGDDQEAKIWEERNSAGSMNAKWIVRANLTEARRAVNAVAFSPRQFGLKLAVASADGCVRIYEAVDIMNLAQWPLAATLQAFQDSNRIGCTSLSWGTGRFEPSTIVVGGTHLVIYSYSDKIGRAHV